MTLLDLDLREEDLLVHAGQWRLSRVEVINWGTFDGAHSVEVGRRGHLFTGPSGSGKSSLLDAIAAVLTPKGSVTFNAAAQESGARDTDRNWVSYIRGAWSKEADEQENRTQSRYLRTSTTWSAIMLRFENKRDAPISLFKMFHLRGSSTDLGDVREMNFITRDDHGLDHYAAYAQSGIDARKLQADHDPVIVTTTGKHSGYFQRLQRLLGIRSDTALQLLHKTQAAKNLGTLDTLFRRFMLDEPATFKRAESAVEQFSELRDAYNHVVDLRGQRDILVRVTHAADAYETAHGTVMDFSALTQSLSTYAAQLKLDLSRNALTEAEGNLATAERRLQAHLDELEMATERWMTANARTLELGGADVAAHRHRVDDAIKAHVAATDRRAALVSRLAKAGVQPPTTESEYEQLFAAAQQELSEPAPPPLAHAAFEQAAHARQEASRLEAAIAALASHNSKIDHRLLAVRDALAAELGVPAELMPFAGELISVRDEHAEWTGAIERVLRPLASTLLVREQEFQAVRRAINARHLGVDLRFESVPSSTPNQVRPRGERSLFYRVDVSAGLFEKYLGRRLSADFDFDCVNSPEDLEDVPRGVTVTGLVKRSGNSYVKDDRYNVNDQTRWVLGADVTSLRIELETRLASKNAELAEADAQVQQQSSRRDAIMRRRDILDQVLATPWTDIDTQRAQDKVDQLNEQLSALVDPSSDLGQANDAEQRAHAERRRLQDRADQSRDKRTRAQDEVARIQSLVERITSEAAVPLEENHRTALNERFRAHQRSIKFDQVDSIESRVLTELRTQTDQAREQKQEAVTDFTREATHFESRWPSAAANANLTTSIEDRGGYREVLHAIQARGLPEHEANFRQLLERRSRESIAHLRDDLLSAQRQIENRISPVNESLGRSPFDRDRYLRIKVKLRRTAEVAEFLDTLRSIVDGNWTEDDLPAAERRFHHLSSIMTRLGSSDRTDRDWKTRVLDTREHVSFIAEEVDRTGAVHNVYESSAGLSGGQRQKLVVFCLAAALRYQLAEPDAEEPQFGTVVLDEAFDKADSEYTRMAMDIFVSFGFQMILATPGKLLQTLEPYLDAVTVVNNPERQHSQLSNVSYG